MVSSALNLTLPAMMASVVISAVINTILRKIALVPLNAYPFFLTQIQTLVYVFFYGAMLLSRYRSGTVTPEMLRIRKSPFLWIGMWDGVGDLLGNLGTSQLPGYQVPLLAKLNIVFTAMFSQALLGKRYSSPQLLSMAVVIAGSLVTLIPSVLANGNQTGGSIFYALVYIASVAPTALAFVLKEQVFRENQHLNLDIFVVNSFGSVVGLFFTVLLLPIAAIPGLGKVQLSELPEYMVDGFICFTGRDPTTSDDCTGSPIAPVLYLLVNLVYNIAFLTLIKHGGALLTFITNTVTFPLSTILFTFGWPLLGSSKLNVYVLLGLCVELVGIVLYHQASARVAKEIESTEAGEPPLSEHTPLATKAPSEREPESELTPPCCYNQTLRKSLNCRRCNSEEVCKNLLSSKCNCC